MTDPALAQHRPALARVIEQALRSGAGPVLLFGAGKLVAATRPLTLAPWGSIVGVGEDDPNRTESTWAGLPVLRGPEIDRCGAGTVVVCSVDRTVQERMASRLAPLVARGVGLAFCPELGLETVPPKAAPARVTPPPPVNLNLGGGHAWVEPGWLNLEGAMAYDFGAYALEGFGDGCAERIYSSHALEHVDLSAAQRVLADCRRVLRPGGTLRLVVPDCEKFIRAWREDDAPFLTGNPALTEHFSTLRECAIHMGGNPGRFDEPSKIGHRCFYDQWTLTWLLLLSGFRQVRTVDYCVSRDQVMGRQAATGPRGQLVGGFDHPAYRPISLYIEAVGEPA